MEVETKPETFSTRHIIRFPDVSRTKRNAAQMFLEQSVTQRQMFLEQSVTQRTYGALSQSRMNQVAPAIFISLRNAGARRFNLGGIFWFH
jgi:hypothetical protein